MVCSFDLVDIEVEEQLAGLDLIAFSDLRIEAVAVHGYGINTDVDQKFHAGGACKADSVLGISDRSDLAVERSYDIACRRLDAYAVAEDAACKGLIFDVLTCNDKAVCGSLDFACFTADDGLGGNLDLSSGNSGGFLLLFFFPEDIGQNEGNTAGDKENDGVQGRIVDGQVAGNTGYAVSLSANARAL